MGGYCIARIAFLAISSVWITRISMTHRSITSVRCSPAAVFQCFRPIAYRCQHIQSPIGYCPAGELLLTSAY